jgi:glycosyltransferase involved in cell wall biosynthesis
VNKKKLTVALLTPSFLPIIGGVECVVHNLANELYRLGHRPVVIAPYSLYRKFKKQSINVPYEFFPIWPKLYSFLSRFSRVSFIFSDLFYRIAQQKYKFDVWHCSGGYPTGTTLSHFLNKNGVPFIVECTGADINCMPEINYGIRSNLNIDKLFRKWLPKADKLIAISKSVKSKYLELQIDESKIVDIPNGVELLRFKEGRDNSRNFREKYNIESDVFLFLCVARNNPVKGIKYIVEAVEHIKKETKPFKIIIVGKSMSSIKKKVENKSLNDFFLFINEFGQGESNSKTPQFPSQELIDIYNSADTFVFPSLMETFGIVIIEAMAADLPIITTDGPGCRDVVRNGADGLMVPVKDGKALSEAMVKILHDQNLRESLVSKSKERALQFNWSKISGKYVSLFENVIEKKKAEKKNYNNERFLKELIKEGLEYTPGNFQFYLNYLFDGVDFKNKRVLDIGGGSGVFSLYAAHCGASEIICLEPDAEGSNVTENDFFCNIREKFHLNNVELKSLSLQQFDVYREKFDVIILHNSINHLNESACMSLNTSEDSKQTYKSLLEKCYLLSQKGSNLVICDCSNMNFFNRIGLKNPFVPMIEWDKHQPPELWIELLEEVGFVSPEVSWSSFNKLRSVGQFFLSNKLMAFFTTSHFRLKMLKN